MPKRSKKIIKLPPSDQPKIALLYFAEKPKKRWLEILTEHGYEVKQMMPEEHARFEHTFYPDAILLYFNAKSVGAASQFIQNNKRNNEHLPLICLTTMGKMEDVVTLMKTGAYDCLELPLQEEKLLLSVSHAIETYQLTKRVSLLESQVHWEGHFDEIVGISAAMQEIFQMIKTVARSSATVLLLGESGTGKELVAKSIHHHSGRDSHRFIDINCGAIPKELLENELFGHERGAFTGADRRYIGSVERAHKGTLFLDEIGEMDVNLQVKLLRLLQERTFQRIGGTEKQAVDLRVVAATNRDLRAEVERGNFREELYYRLNVVPIHIPPLRARREDIPLIAKHFLKRYAEENNRKFKDFVPEALQALVNYDWPGNVRELENSIERVVVLHDDVKVKPVYLPRFIQKAEHKVALPDRLQQAADPYYKIVPLPLVEQYTIESTLEKCDGDVVVAAKKLQIGQATLYRKLKRYGIKV